MNDDEDLSSVSSLTEAQQKALALLPLFTGALSIWGSTNIIYAVSRTPSDQRSCYRRILLGLSCSDFVSSLAASLQPFLLPEDTSHRIWASGTDATCTAMGFFQQLSMSNIWYNGMLSFVFLLMIKYAVSETHLSKKYEPWMHGLAIGFPLITACLALALGLYGELRVSPFCYMTGPPMATYIAFSVAGLPNLIFFVVIPLNNFLIYCHVRRATRTNSGCADSQEGGDLELQEACGPPPTNLQPVAWGENRSQASADSSHKSHVTASSTATCMSAEREQERERHLAQARERAARNRQNRRIQAVAFQAFLFVASFFATYLPTNILRITTATSQYDSSDEDKVFGLLLLQAIFLPAQGLFNYLIFHYNRSSYLRETGG